MIREKSKKIRGLDLAWLQAGSAKKPILLFLHGFPDDAWIWDQQIEFFSKDFQVIAPFLRGVGKSEGPDSGGRYKLHAFTLDLINLVNHVDPSAKRDLYVVGHDIGSAFAWSLAEHEQKRLKGLVITNGSHLMQFMSRLKNIKQVSKSWYMGVFFVPFLPEFILRKGDKDILEFMHYYGGMPPEYRIKSKVKGRELQYLVKYYRGLLKSVPSRWLDQSVSKIDQPVLLIHSKDDAFVEPSTPQEVAPFSDQAQIEIIEGKHWIQAERPKAFNKLLSQFFKKQCGA